MSAKRSLLLSAAEAAHALRLSLGPRQWRDFLTDCRRDRRGLGGWLALMPYATSGGRPLYHPTDISTFMSEAQKAFPELTPGLKLTAEPYIHDDTIGLPWQMRKAKPSVGGKSSLI